MLDFVSVFRFFCGYVTFEASGGFPDKFLNSCKREGITLFGVRKQNGVITANSFISDYRRMPFARRDSDMRVRIRSRHGIPFVVYNRRNRVGVLIGVAVFCILLSVLSGRVWNIEVVGNTEVDVNDIIDAYAAENVTIGTRVSSVNLDRIKENVIDEVPGIIWTSFNASGGLGIINVREGEEVPDLKNDNPPRNVVAKYGGQITKYEVYEGSAEQVVNAAVAEGDLLISGVLTLADGATLLKAADGTVEAKTSRKVTTIMDERFKVYSVSDVNRGTRISFFGMRTPLLPWNPECDKVLSSGLESYAVLGGVILPVGTNTSDRIAFSEVNYWNDLEGDGARLLSIGLDAYFRKHGEEMGESDIKKSDILIYPEEKRFKFEGTYESIENICEYSEIAYE